MSEQILKSPEAPVDPTVLPTGEKLQSVYEMEFQAIELPETYRWAEDGETGNMTISNVHPSEVITPDRLKDTYLRQAPNNALANSWWNKVGNVLEQNAAVPNQEINLHLNAKHTLDVVAEGKPTGQKYEVFEVGEPMPDPELANVAFDTLKLIDQFSGGLLSVDDKRQRVVLGSGIRMAGNNGGSEKSGFATEDAVYINLSGLMAKAEQSGASARELVAVVIVHELLGHGLERAVEGFTGSHFSKNFKYSLESRKGERFDRVHGDVTPKDSSKTGSVPVREYGYTNASEDFASSTDSLVADVMGWTDVNKSPTFASVPDAYRSELVMQLMDKAAQRAAKYDTNPGFVGSEVRYVENPADGSLQVEPVRNFEVTTIRDEAAVQEEIQSVVDKLRPGEQFVIDEGDLV